MPSERITAAPTSTRYVPSAYDDTIVATPPRKRKRRWFRRLILALLVVIAALVAIAAAVYEDPALLEPIGGAMLGTQPGTVAWNGHDPLNILVMGIDQRTNEQTRSDTMMVLRVDPSSRDVKMLSVPRDLWVNIPSPPQVNYGYYKINAAYALGGPQGQGPQFAQLAVESNLHIPIDYYAVIRFGGFKNVVDALGGVNICVPQPIDDPSYPADVGNGFAPLHLKAGCQQMDGATALRYVRERHVYAQQDLGRIQSQQALMASIEKKLLSPDTVLHAPAIMSAIDNAVISNMPHSVLPQLGLLLGRAKGAHTQHAYLNQDGGYVTDTTSADGQNILAPNWPRINALVASLFPEQRLHEENAVVQVRNGQHTAGLAATYTTILQSIGFNVAEPRTADKQTYARNLVVVNADRPGADYTARKLARMLQADVADRHIGADHPQVIAILGSQTALGS